MFHFPTEAATLVSFETNLSLPDFFHFRISFKTRASLSSAMMLGSLGNHDGDGDKNATNLHI